MTQKKETTRSDSKLTANSSKLSAKRSTNGVQAQARRRAQGSGGRRKGTGQSPRRRSAPASDWQTTVLAYWQTTLANVQGGICANLLHVPQVHDHKMKGLLVAQALRDMNMSTAVVVDVILSAAGVPKGDLLDQVAARIRSVL